MHLPLTPSQYCLPEIISYEFHWFMNSSVVGKCQKFMKDGYEYITHDHCENIGINNIK